MMSLPHETTINVCLAEVLSKSLSHDDVVVPEEQFKGKGRSRRFDIKIEHRGIEFILEASFNRKDAVNDAKKRIEEGLIVTVSVAVYYNPSYFKNVKTPEKIKQILQKIPLEVKIFAQGRDISNTLFMFIHQKKKIAKQITKDWISVRVDEFAEFLDSVVEFVVREDLLNELLEEIEVKVNNFVEDSIYMIENDPRIKESVYKELYKVLFSPSEKSDNEVEVPNVPLEVVIAHAYISLFMASVLYESVAPKHGLDSLQRLLSQNRDHPLLAMKDAFTNILRVDYEPVFDVALSVVDILFNLQTSHNIMQDLVDLIRVSSMVVVNKAILRQDFIGHVYHKITGDISVRKGYATYYTKAPIAYFLAYLALYTPNPEWEYDWCSFDSLKNFKICDNACGSGTLLSASYTALLSKYRSACLNSGKDLNLEEFHKIMLEKSIWGFDALEHSVQTASVVLSLHEAGVPLKNMNMYHIPVDSKGSLGSLNLWWANTLVIPMKRHGVAKIDKKRTIIPNDFCLIIMNPPFARSTAPGIEGSRPRIFDFVATEKAFSNLWKKYIRLIGDMERYIILNKDKRSKIVTLYDSLVGKNKVFLPQNINPLNAGASFPFVVLSSKYLQKGGRLALVLPKTVIESSAFFLLRLKLITDFHIEYIVFSSEDNNPNFSYSTDLSEILLIARKVAQEEEKRDTIVINLKNQPKSTLEGILLAKEIIKNDNLSVGDRKIIRALSSKAEIFKLKKELLEEFSWNFSILTDNPPTVIELVSNILYGKLFGISIPIRKFGQFDDLLITNPRKFRGNNLRRLFVVNPGGELKILKRTGKYVYSSFKLDISKLEDITPINKTAKEIYKKVGATILVPEAIRFNTIPLIAVRCDKPIISSRAHMIKFICENTEKLEKALCAWFNSTYVISYLKSLFTTVEGSFGHLYAWHLKTIPVPDLTHKELSDNLAKIFDVYSNVVWPPLPKQYELVLNREDMTRLKYDMDILKALAKSHNDTINMSNISEILLNIYRELLYMIK